MDDGIFYEGAVIEGVYVRRATWKAPSGAPINVRFSGPSTERAKIDEQFDRIRKILEKGLKP